MGSIGVEVFKQDPRVLQPQQLNTLGRLHHLRKPPKLACKHLDLSLVDKYHCMYAGGLKPGKTYYYLLTSFTLSPSPILERLVDIVQDETIAFYFVPFLSSRPLSKQVKSSAREQIS